MKNLIRSIHNEMKPDDPVDIKYTTTVFILRKKYTEWSDTVKHWDIDKIRAFTLVLVHYTPKFEGKLEGMDEYNAIKKGQNVVKLLVMIRNISHGQDETKHSIMALVESDINMYTTIQGPDQNIMEFLWTFWLHKKLYDQYLQEAVTVHATVNDVADATDDMKEQVTMRAADKYLVCLFLHTYDNKR